MADDVWRPLRIALGLLTRFPIPWRGQSATARELGDSVLCYPLIGLIIGGALAGLAELSRAFATDPGLGAMGLLIAWVWMTGGMHLEGLADTADGWIGGLGDRERALAILKDPHSGPFGVMALVLVLLLKWNLLRVMLMAPPAWEFWLLAPLLGRAGIVVLFLTLPYARPGGMGATAAAELSPARGMGVSLLAMALTGWLASWWVVIVWSGALILLHRAWKARFGGITGDTSGASCELLEIWVLMAGLF
ncbi:MAG: adenosylcobinamide-GDP ribazoletransferase [Magnetococcales bacterium]|nr:adenosylcobinamide-GDP ribazoletransferase [Magnetococcales bacterium]